ncbi:hypothetical protein H4R33_001806 [Dimargaris cristalligena]|nr:hypothetical protein H4R33_001806 [Dimargaris cristalligena]
MTVDQSEYEKKRLENIQRNAAILKELNLGGPSGFSSPTASRSAKTSGTALGRAAIPTTPKGQKRRATSRLEDSMASPATDSPMSATTRRVSRRLQNQEPDVALRDDPEDPAARLLTNLMVAKAAGGDGGAPSPSFPVLEPARKRRYSGELSLADTMLLVAKPGRLQTEKEAQGSIKTEDGESSASVAATPPSLIQTFVSICQSLAAPHRKSDTSDPTTALTTDGKGETEGPETYPSTAEDSQTAQANYRQLASRFQNLRITHPRMATNEDGNGGDDSTSGPPAASSWEPTCKVTPERIYTVALHPDPRQFLVAAGDKSGVLGFWNIGSTDQFTSASQKTPDEAVKVKMEEEEEADLTTDAPGNLATNQSPLKSIRQSVSMADMTTADVFSFRPHTATLTQLLYNKRDATKLYTSSYDGSIRCLDLIHQTFTEACVTETGDRFITGFDNDPGTGQLLYYTTSDGTLGFHDLRTPATDITAWQLQERKIGGMHLNPVEPQYLVTASLDRTMRVWDLRWMGGARSKQGAGFTDTVVQLSPGTDDPVEVSTFDYPKSVTAAYWDPTGNHIVNTNFDDTIRLSTMDWSSAPDSSSSLTATGDSNAKGGSPNLRERFVIRHNNQTGRWLTMFRAQWHPDPTMPPCFVVGNMKRYVDIFCGSTGELVTQLYDPDRITAVPAVNVFHAHLPVVVSANASGRMVVWS